jgi:hypothetical protein
MPTKKNILASVLLPAVGGLASTLLSLTAAHAIVQMTYLTNYVGDIVSFVPSSNPPVEDGVRLIVHRRDQFGCILDLDVLRRSGGSLIVEGQVSEAVERYEVHWAGERTAADTGNCGKSADLILDGEQLDILATGAGGYGTAGSQRLSVRVVEVPI